VDAGHLSRGVVRFGVALQTRDLAWCGDFSAAKTRTWSRPPKIDSTINPSHSTSSLTALLTELEMR
jgi:hypothetical protein